jgi:nucleoid-associated protein YgaU
MQKRLALLAALATGLLSAACAQKTELKPTVAEPTPTVVPTEVPPLQPAVHSGHYLVKPGDSLWKIAGQEGVLKDSFQWPLLYKENRDQISDPDLIDPQQDLTFKEKYDDADVQDAVEKAKDTPAYNSHVTDKKALPLNY